MQTEIRPWLRDRPILVWALRAAPYVGLVNFVVFFIVAMAIGGDAVAGHEAAGRFFLSSHGKLTEVSRAVFEYSKVHTLSLWVTHPLAIAAVGVMHGFHFTPPKRPSR
jgi:hypothetical protein